MTKNSPEDDVARVRGAAAWIARNVTDAWMERAKAAERRIAELEAELSRLKADQGRS